MSAYQGSDWFKSGAHVKVSSVESKKQLVYQAYVADGATHSSQVLSLLKTKEQQLQHEVNKCAELRAENVLLQKRLQVRSPA